MDKRLQKGFYLSKLRYDSFFNPIQDGGDSTPPPPPLEVFLNPISTGGGGGGRNPPPLRFYLNKFFVIHNTR